MAQDLRKALWAVIAFNSQVSKSTRPLVRKDIGAPILILTSVRS